MQKRERRLISRRCHKNRTHPALIMIMFYSLPLSLSSFLPADAQRVEAAHRGLLPDFMVAQPWH